MRRLARSFIIPTLITAGLLLAPTALDAQNPFLQADESWITIDGTVIDVMRDQFTLDFGEGVVTVEFDDGDRDADGYLFRPDDEVTVTGRVDDDFLDVATIEASSVYVKNADTYFYASALDEEDRLAATIEPASSERMMLRGTVSWVGDREFMLDTGFRDVTIEVDEMPYDPLDESGYQHIEVGDYVSVTAIPDYRLFEGRTLDARSIITISGSS